MSRAALLLLLLCPLRPAWAKASGIASTSCNGCHGGASLTSVKLEGPAASIAPGATVPLTVTLEGPGVNVGGLYLTAYGAGTFNPGSGQRLLGMGVAHSTPRAASGGKVIFTLSWTAPTTPGGTDFDVVAVGGNGDNRSSGDLSGGAHLSLVWGCTGVTYYADYDGDGHGSAENGTTLRCSLPASFSALNDDCNDNDRQVFTGAPEACNGKDDNCNGQVDEGLASVTTWPDLDGDGFGDSRGTPLTGCVTGKRAANNTDCDDTSALIHPGGTEVCNRKDDNCDGRTDDGVQVRCGVGWCERLGPTCDLSLCTPGNPVTEVCNALDDDCDGQVDEGQLCGANGTCFEGQCYAGDAPLPVTDAGAPADAGHQSPPPPEPGCASAPGGLCLLAGALLRRRKSPPRR